MLTEFFLTSFRGIKNQKIPLWFKTYIQWANWSGKTHILDAIHLLSGSRLLYGNTEIEQNTLIEATFSQNDLSKSYKLYSDEMRDSFSIQWSRMTKPKYMLSLPWRTVYISPFDMNLLYFAPQMRRDAMDLVLSRVYWQFIQIKKDYEKVMRERNFLLKKIRDGAAKKWDISFWDHKLVELAEIYLTYRYRYSEYIQNSLIHFPGFFKQYPIIFQYQSSMHDHVVSWANFHDEIIGYLLNNRDRDIITGHTHIGPHRDDWGFKILQNPIWSIADNYGLPSLESQSSNEQLLIPIESYLSRGEMKMVLLWFKMIEANFIAEKLGSPVVLLIDDIFAELDEKNSDIFLNSLTTHQIILTSQKPLPNHEKYHDFICINLEHSYYDA